MLLVPYTANASLFCTMYDVDMCFSANNNQEWSYLRGGLTTLDRDYGLINNIHHDIGTHVIHHLFPQIPHYNLVEAVSNTYFHLNNLAENSIQPCSQF